MIRYINYQLDLMQRVRKEPKGKKGKGNILLGVVVLFVAVACGMYLWDNGFTGLPLKTTTPVADSISTDVSNNEAISEVAKAEAMLHGIQVSYGTLFIHAI